MMLKSGRDAGKSTSIAKYVYDRFVSLSLDILITRANYGDLYKSMFAEIMAIIEEEGFLSFVEERRKPLKIINKLNGNEIRFEGIGGADLSRTKGFKPKKKLSLIVVDEMQQLPDQTNLDQALATFRRHLDDVEGQVILAFNPERQNAHWANLYYNARENEDEWECLYTSYKDIVGVLSKKDVDAIELEKIVNPSNYDYLYLGITKGLFGGVYHTFNRASHLIPKDDLMALIKKHGIHQVLIGTDSATTIDATALVPVLILNNGQAVAVEYFHHEPKTYGALSNDRLYPLILRFVDDLEKEYDLRFRGTPITFVVDNANSDLIQHLSYHLPSRYRVFAYSDKKIIQMANVMVNAFSKNVLLVLDTGGVHNYVSNLYQHNIHPLVDTLESVLWDKDGKTFDRSIPNDDTDALTYAIAYYFINPDNIYLPDRQKFYERSERD
jgi:hypothetical protein